MIVMLTATSFHNPEHSEKFALDADAFITALSVQIGMTGRGTMIMFHGDGPEEHKTLVKEDIETVLSAVCEARGHKHRAIADAWIEALITALPTIDRVIKSIPEKAEG